MASDEQIQRLKERLGQHDKRISKLERLLQEKPQAVRKPMSIREFILAKKPENDVQKALAIGYYLEKHEDFSSFNVRNLADGFRAAKERVPQNVSDKVQWNIRKGHMMEAKAKKNNLKAWFLTGSGEEYVESGFTKRR
jgi:hypothetical protein